MKSIRIIFLALSIAGILFFSCKHEPLILPIIPQINGGTGNGNGNGNGGNIATCSPDTIYFQNDILPLFVSNCAITGCHNAISHRSGRIYDTYSNIMSTGSIHPFSLSGKTYTTMVTTNPGDRMPPPPHPPLTSTQIGLIETWINQGALNNVCNSGTCDTTNVTYAATIVPILQSRCNGCHNSSSPGGNINLTAFAGVQTVALNGRLWGSVNFDPAYSQMPKNTSQIPGCELAQIRIWIQNGALNN